MHKITQALFLTSILVLPACSHINAAETTDKAAESNSLRGDIMFASMLCNSSETGANVRLVRDQAQLEAFYAQLQSNTLGAKHPVPRMNYAKEMILIVEMGQQATGGYQISFDSRQRIKFDGNHASVTVKWIEPDADTMTTQMITSPCVMIRMTAAPIKTISVFDQDGKLRHSTRAQ